MCKRCRISDCDSMLMKALKKYLEFHEDKIIEQLLLHNVIK